MGTDRKAARDERRAGSGKETTCHDKTSHGSQSRQNKLTQGELKETCPPQDKHIYQKNCNKKSYFRGNPINSRQNYSLFAHASRQTNSKNEQNEQAMQSALDQRLSLFTHPSFCPTTLIFAFFGTRTLSKRSGFLKTFNNKICMKNFVKAY